MNVVFPYAKMRETQEEFVNDLLKCLNEKKHMIAHAPTGIGKTASVLSAILPHAIKEGKTVFFLTSRHTQHKIAIETLKDIKKKHDIGVKVIDLIGKRNMCSQFGADELSGGQFYEYCRTMVENEECEYYQNMWSKIGVSVDARNFVKGNTGVYHVEEFLDLAKKTQLCPYELALLKAKKANVIIADYYHVFNPSIREAFFAKTGKFLEKSIIVVDEAHNLPGRLREMMSSSLTEFVLEMALKEAEQNEEVYEILMKIRDRFEDLYKDVVEEKLVKKEDFMFEDFEDFHGILEMMADTIREVKKRSYIGSVLEFLKQWHGGNEGFVRYMEKSKFKDKISYKLYYNCLDPALNMQEVVDKSLIVLMSGTLLPLEMYRDLLKVDNVELKEYGNPFPEENKLSLVIPETSTKYSKRSDEMFKMIADKCSKTCDLVPGNVLILFPSYAIMNIVNQNFNVNGKSVFMEVQGMGKEEKEEMLEKFRSYKKTGAVLFAVAAGSFGEGIDLPGDELKGVIIVGLPLSRPDIETKSLINYYDDRFGRGWDYGYIFPAMKRVVQGAGRCIRSEKDKGVIVFLDERYSMSNYMRCFPKDYNVKVTKLPEGHIKKFFEN
jgi:DNA excision repair protein ERCC-2